MHVTVRFTEMEDLSNVSDFQCDDLFQVILVASKNQFYSDYQTLLFPFKRRNSVDLTNDSKLSTKHSTQGSSVFQGAWANTLRFSLPEGSSSAWAWLARTRSSLICERAGTAISAFRSPLPVREGTRMTWLTAASVFESVCAFRALCALAILHFSLPDAQASPAGTQHPI